MSQTPASQKDTKQRQLVNTLRNRILDGSYAPGERMPTRVELEASFDVGWFTVQQAFDMLRREGFVRTDGRRGTFVVDRPPHLHRYALVFQRRASGKNPWSQYYVALAHAAEDMHRARPEVDWAMFYVEDRTDEDYLQLIRQIAAHRFAGIVFAVPPIRLMQTPIVQTPDVPRVVIASQPIWKGMGALHYDYAALIDKAVNTLAGRGRKRLAMVAARADNKHFVLFREAVAKYQLTTCPAWCQAIHESHLSMTGNLAALLMSQPSGQRPDGLIILDDNLVEHFTIGLLDAGLRVADDLDVVAFCNFPSPSASAFPVIRLGFDNHQMLSKSIELLHKQHEGEPFETLTLLPPVFEDELSIPASID